MNSMTLLSGQPFNFNDILSNTLSLEDIAASLSKQCRFTGHCNRFYSVAQHSVFVSLIIDEGYEREGLLHDASEAVLGDPSSPLKALLPDYQKIEEEVLQLIWAENNLRENAHISQVKKADLLALVTEAHYLHPKAKLWNKIDGISPLTINLEPESPLEAEFHFLNRARELGLR